MIGNPALLALGDEGPDVLEIQRRLLSPVLDGVFSDELVSRVRGFQWAHEIPMTGEIDEVTLAKLRRKNGNT